MRRFVFVGVVAGALGTVAACERTPDDELVKTDSPVTFTPKCGKAGDSVRVVYSDLGEGCQSSKEVVFAPDVRASGPSGWTEGAFDSHCYVDVVIPEGAQTGPIKVPMSRGQAPSDNPFTIPCPPDAGPDASEAGVDSGNALAAGAAFEVGFPKTDTATAGRLSQTADGKILVSATAGDANLTELDPATGVVKQTLLPGITAGASARSEDGSTVIVGRSGIDPFAMLLDDLQDVVWAFTFGASLERAVAVRPHGASSFLVAYDDKVLELPASGTGATSHAFGLPASANTRDVASLPGGAWAFAAELERTFPEQDALVVKMEAGGTIGWQTLLANGGRTLVSSLTPLANGGLVMTGVTRPAGPTAPMDGLVVAFGPDGAVTWQRTFGTGGAVRLESAVETADAILVGGTSGGKFTAIDLAKADGAVRSATSYDLTTSLPLGMARRMDGALVFAGTTTTEHTYQFLTTAPDLQVVCGNGTSLGATQQITSAAGTLNVSTPTFAATSSAATTTPVTVTPGAQQTLTPVDKCGN